jgi:hypothetical protein
MLTRASEGPSKADRNTSSDSAGHFILNKEKQGVMKKRYPFLLLGVLLSLTGMIFGQTGTSRVTGNVLDAAGAVVPSAKVTITNEGTNAEFTMTTGSGGSYAFDSIQLGTYTVTVEAQGFKKFISKGNILTNGVPLTVNAALEVGGANDTVEVTGSFERVQTSTSGNFGTTVDNRTLTDLPLGLDATSGGRNPLVFVRLQPGVTTGANTGGGSHVNGARDRAFNYTLDGIDINETSAGGSEFSPLRTNPDSLQEFRVITSNATADRGRSSGAQVELVTKSGTNEFHGNLFYFHRNSALSANEWQNGLLGVAKPALRQHQFGGDVGGPILKDRTFFFFNYQGQKQVIPVQVTRTVYTDSVKQGIFRYVVGSFTDGSGVLQPRRNNPFGTTANGGAVVDAAGNPLFPNCSATVTTNCIASYNIIGNDPRRLGVDPTIQSRVLSLLPSPNLFTGGDGLNTANYVFSEGRLDPQRDFVFKIDHNLTNTQNISVRYAWGKQDTINDSTNSGLPAFPGLPPKVNTTRDPRNLAVNYRWQIRPNLINELVVGGNHFTFNFINPSVGAQAFSIITINPTDPLDFQAGNLRTLNTYQVVDNLSWTKGTHLFKGGINFRYQQHRDIRGSLGGQNANPIVNILGGQTVNVNCLNNGTGVNAAGQEFFCLPTVASGSGSSLVLGINTNDRPRLQSTINDLLGRVFSITQGFTADFGLTGFSAGGTNFINDARYPEYDFYFQDTWKFRPNLTIDLGLRYEAKLTPFARGRLYTPNQLVSVGAPGSSTLRWIDNDLYGSDLNNWSPSLGFAWDPRGDGKTSIRANYRLAYDRINTFVLSSAIYNTIPGVTLGVVNTEFGQNGGPGLTGGRIRDGIPGLTPSASVIPQQQLQPAAFGTGTITVVDPEFRAPKTNQWGLSIQRDVWKDIVVDVSYIGRRASGLFGAYDINQVDIFRNNFLREFNIVNNGPIVNGQRTAGNSALFNQLYGPDTRRNANETGSQFAFRNLRSSFDLNSVAAVAADAAGRIQGGRSLVNLAGLPNDFFRPFSQFGTINVIDSNDYSTYHALQVLVQRKFAKGVQFQGSYTWSKSLDTRSFDPAFTTAGRGSGQSASSTPFDIYRRYLNYARSDFDRTHVFVGYAIWDLPFGKSGLIGRDAPGFVQRVIEGWNITGVATIETGRPFTIYTGSNQLTNVLQSTANCNNCSRSLGKVDKVSSVFGGVPGYFTAEDLAKFSQPAAGELGNTGRNYFTGPGFWNVDMTVLKRTKFTETANFELRFEFFNVLNRVNFGFPDAILNGTTFGRIRTNVASDSRKIRVGAKINF